MSNIINLKAKKRILVETEEAPEKEAEVIKTPKKRQEEKNSAQKPISQTLTNIEWQAMEFTKYEKDPLWFLIGGALALVLLLVAIFTKNFIFALIILLAGFSIYIWAQKEPRKIRFAIVPKGIKIENEIYNFENLKSFWIFYDPPEIKYLSIVSKKLFMPKIIIPLADENPNKIREALLKFLPEEEQEESLIDVLGRYLRY